MILTGGCFCGAVRYEVRGGVHDTRSCHCSRCRKAFSSQANAYGLVDPEQFRWVQGEEYLTTYPAEGEFGKRFCRICGSALCGIAHGRVHGITLGCLDSDEGLEIEAHIFVASKAAWEVMPEGVRQYDEFPPGWPKTD